MTARRSRVRRERMRDSLDVARSWRAGLWRWLGLAAALLTLLSAGFRPSLSTADVGGERLSHPQGLELTATLAGPTVAAPAAVIYDVDSGRMLFEKNSHERRAVGSTTKLATALVALRHLDLQQTITVGPEVENVAGTVIGLEAGDQATVEKLLYGTLLTSGNDAALALAAGTGGSVEQFVNWMNDLAGELGLRDTHFVNPHGLDAPDHYSSAYDLALLAQAALRNPIIAKAVATPETRIDDWRFINRNELLGQYPGVDGVKTGTTDEAGECLIVSATRDGHRVIAVVLGSQDRYADGRALLDFYYARYAWLPADAPANRFSALPPDAAGRARYLTAAAQESMFVAGWERPWVRCGVEVDVGLAGGVARCRSAGFVLAQVPLEVRAP